MRTFISLELPDEFRGEVAAVSRALSRACGGDGHFLPYENLHVTLAFLGEIDEAQSGDAVSALDEACSGVAPVGLCPDGLGKFGRSSDATLWLGLRHTPDLTGLASRVREGLSAWKLPYDPKPFLAHVTLARRVRLPRGSLPAIPFPEPAEATRVTLFRSILDSTGATYKPLYSVTLGSGQG